jgi:FkbM family methyltransferase
VKSLVKRFFNIFGLDLQRKQPAALRIRTSLRGALGQVSRLGFKPRTIIDVGVAFDTRELYEEFSQATILLIEPLVEFEPTLQRICETYDAQYVLAAASDKRGTAILNVHDDKLDSSSLQKESEGPRVDGTARAVPTVTIDQVCLERKLAGPFLVKADVQGAELLVLDGAVKTLEDTEVAILEISLFNIFKGGPDFFDVVTSMKKRGFVAYDIFGLHYRPFDNALSQIDVMFVRDGSRLREFHGYATPEQRRAIAYKSDGNGRLVAQHPDSCRS